MTTDEDFETKVSHAILALDKISEVFVKIQEDMTNKEDVREVAGEIVECLGRCSDEVSEYVEDD